MSKILVTGGSGFLGSHIADALTEKGHEVTILDVKNSSFVSGKQKMTIGTILDVNFLEKLFSEKFEAVYHLAALADLNEAQSKARETAEVNIVGTINLLEACVKYKVNRFIFGSSVYVYSHNGGFY